jgi:Ca2+-binding EF-hand superfamily protein
MTESPGPAVADGVGSKAPSPDQDDKDEYRGAIVNISAEDAIAAVEEVVKEWTSKYLSYTKYVGPSNVKHKLKLETTFSLPSQEQPVPVAVARVHFQLNLRTQKLSYTFESENVQHGDEIGSLAPGKFEMWLDRIHRDKMLVRKLHSLTTPFEEMRLAAPPAAYDESESEGEEEDAEKDGADEEAAGRQWLQVSGGGQEGLAVSERLSNIFDAADEESEGLLSHREVADLLYATPLGLTDWDIKLLLTTAHENEEGLIEYKPFVQAAPEIIEALLKRRAAFISRKQPNATVTYEAVELCFAEELEEINRTLREQFNVADPNQTNLLSRNAFRSCLLSKPERFSPQEVRMLMQMVKENESSQVPYDDFVFLMQQLRIDTYHNALVETDIESLRVHLILLLRREGVTRSLQLPIWTLRKVLLSADQLCLSRIQVHLLLSIIKANEYGVVDVNYFLRICCTVIPLMFDAAKFMDKATLVAKEKADAQAREELEELQGLTGGMASKAKKGDEEEAAEDERGQGLDREAVEKTLIHLLTTHDEKRSAHHTLEIGQFLNAMHHEQVAQCQLSDAEHRGFIAEAPIDENGDIAYVDHVKTWVPILFEVRKSRVHDAIVSKDWGSDAAPLADLTYYEETFPVLHGVQAETPVEEKKPDTLGESKLSESKRSGTLQETGSARKGSKMSVVRSSARFLHRLQHSQTTEDSTGNQTQSQRNSLRARAHGSLRERSAGSKERSDSKERVLERVDSKETNQ